MNTIMNANLFHALHSSKKKSDSTDSIHYSTDHTVITDSTKYTNTNKYDIMSPYYTTDTMEGDNNMPPSSYFNVNWNEYTTDLSNLAMEENWSNYTYPNNGILANYIKHTLQKLRSERKVIKTDTYELFNTGLFTKHYAAIYAYSDSDRSISFLTQYDLGNKGITRFPERANYFTQPELLLFDWHYEINVNYEHILDDAENKARLPKELLTSTNISTILNGAIDTMKKRVSANYKIAIPQYYDKNIQLLLPLCLQNDNKPDLAIALSKKQGNDGQYYYQGHTCLSLDMAYNNARLIAKPESNWLTN